VIRVATHPKVFARPSGLAETIEFCNFLLEQPHCVVIQPGEQHWSIFCRLCKEADARGNLAPDAWFAALAIESGCEWITSGPRLRAVSRPSVADSGVNLSMSDIDLSPNRAGTYYHVVELPLKLPWIQAVIYDLRFTCYALLMRTAFG
jgi:hypothetical protein